MLTLQTNPKPFIALAPNAQPSVIVEKTKQPVASSAPAVNGLKEIESLSEKLNIAISSLSTNVRFGFDNQSNVFFVSLIDTETNKVLRRFPKEESEYLLERLKEIKGFFIDETV